MKVLWVINGPIKEIGDILKIKTNDSTGWLTGYLGELKNVKEIELFIVFPLIGEKNIIKRKIGNVWYYSFYQKPIFKKLRIPSNKVTRLAKTQLAEIIDEINPDIMHIFGSEFEHSLIAAEIFNNPSHTMVHIQGLVSVISEHYYAGLPKNVLGKFAISNLIRGNLKSQKTKFKQRGEYEIQLIKYVGHVNGRTDWDRACIKKINSQVSYHFCNESLRSSFYNVDWHINECDKRVIFMSQATYPIKGLHFVIEALHELKNIYPEIKLIVAGNNLTNSGGLYNKLRISSYGLYIKALIQKYNLKDNIEFTGFLSEERMTDYLLKANVFISASVIENSPNSVGEAMLVGTPVVTSDVGGVKNVFNHGVDGFSYQYDAPYMLAYYVSKIFEDDKLALRFSENAKNHACTIHDRKINAKTLQSIYKEIID